MVISVPLLVDTDGASVVSLRRHAESDVARVLEQCLDPVSQEWTTIPVPYSIDDARHFVRDIVPGVWDASQEWAFAVDVDGRFGGTVSLRAEGSDRGEVAYGAHPDVRGTGAMERAVRLLLGWAFAPAPEGLGLQTVSWWANRGNFASRRLAWRLGFDVVPGVVRRWLPQRDELLDAYVGSLLATDERRPRSPWLDVPTIESDRAPLRLRRPRDADRPRVVEGCRDPSTSYWISAIPRPYPESHAADWVLRCGEAAATGSSVTFAVADREDDRLLAALDVFDVNERYASAEVGYWVHPDERRRGVAAEAVRLACRHALLATEDGGMGLARLRAHAGVGNTASRAVLTGAGFREVGVEHLGTRTADGLADAVLFELLDAARLSRAQPRRVANAAFRVSDGVITVVAFASSGRK